MKKHIFTSVSIYEEELASIDYSFTQLLETGVFLNWRRKVVDAKTEIKRDKPSIIVVDYAVENSFEHVKELAAATTQFRNYFPFILLFNFHEKDIDAYRHTVHYHFVLGTSLPINEDLILRLVALYREKKMSKEQVKAASNLKQLLQAVPSFQGGEKVFYDVRIHYPPEDLNGIVKVKHMMEIIWMTEFEMVFFSRTPLSVGEIYLVEIPTQLNIVIVPHFQGSKEETLENCYRGIIHFIKETDKQALRRFINHVTNLSETRKMSIKEEEIKEIKLQYLVDKD